MQRLRLKKVLMNPQTKNQLRCWSHRKKNLQQHLLRRLRLLRPLMSSQVMGVSGEDRRRSRQRRAENIVGRKVQGEGRHRRRRNRKKRPDNVVGRQVEKQKQSQVSRRMSHSPVISHSPVMSQSPMLKRRRRTVVDIRADVECSTFESCRDRKSVV